jgi:hypothetical protein
MGQFCGPGAPCESAFQVTAVVAVAMDAGGDTTPAISCCPSCRYTVQGHRASATTDAGLVAGSVEVPPDVRRIQVCPTLRREHEIILGSSPTSEEALLRQLPSLLVEGLAWAPDGSHLAFGSSSSTQRSEISVAVANGAGLLS